MKTLSERAARYERDGFLIIPSLISKEECDQLKLEARKVLDEQAAPGRTIFMHVAAVNEAFRALSEDPRVVDVLREIMPEGVMFLSDKIVYKTAEETKPTPWHIDSFYWRNTRPKLSIWIPLDDVSAANGTLTVIPGSHKKEWQTLKREIPSSGEFNHEIADADWKADEVLACTVPRGSLVIFSDRTAHGSTPNVAAADRYVIISTYHAPAEDEPFDLEFPARKVLVSATASGA